MKENKRPSSPKILVDDSYFKEARQWFNEIYIAPVSSRSFFLILGIIALSVLLIALVAIIQLTPVNEPVTLTINHSAIDETETQLVRIRPPGMGLNASLKRFMVAQYVTMRESYKPATWEGRRNFIRAYSDALVAAADEKASADTNPQSYRALLGEVGERLVTIQDVYLARPPKDPNAPREAVVRFTVQYRKVSNLPESSWTATLRFHYSNTRVAETESADKASGKLAAGVPLFKVVSYEVVQNR